MLACCLALALTGVVAAQCQNRQGGNHDGNQCPGDKIFGKIVEIDANALTLVVDTDAGKFTVQVTEKTVIKKRCQTIGFADLKVGLSIMARGELMGHVLVADLICVRSM